MNARFLEKLIAYRELHRLDFSRLILSQKIKYQFSLIGRRNLIKQYVESINSAPDVSSLLLIEAKAARNYWRHWSAMVASKASWKGRVPHGNDPINKLLDIGYHYAIGKIIQSCRELDIPTELGIFHKAQSHKSCPLAYDFVEWLRPLVVDRELMVLIRKKKNTVEKIDDATIKYFVYKLKMSFDTLYYNKSLKYCVRLEYWFKLNILQFMKAVNSDGDYRPIFPSLRHETRCKKTAPREAVMTAVREL